MVLSTWLRDWKRSPERRSALNQKGGRLTRRALTFKPSLEELETRILPAQSNAVGFAEVLAGLSMIGYGGYQAKNGNVVEGLVIGYAGYKVAALGGTNIGINGLKGMANQIMSALPPEISQAGTSLALEVENALDNLFGIPSAQAAPAPAPTAATRPTPTPTPTPAPSPSPSSGIPVGTYSTTLIPSGVIGVDPNTLQTLTFTLNADGSGSVSASPWTGTTLTVKFPTGTVTANNGLVSADYLDPDGSSAAFSLQQNSNGSLVGGTQSVVQLEDSDDNLAGFNNVTF